MKRILIILTTIFFIGCEEEPTMYTLRVSSNPTEWGTINPTSGEYQEGTEVTLRVNTNTHYEFDKWSGSWSGSESPLTLTMDGDKNIVGNFKLMDSDGDGVTDDLDSCTDTPSGERVDENGCILNPLYLDDNGVTYTIVSEEQLRNMISNNEDVSKVCTSKITNMNYMFSSSQFNGDISNWDVSSVTNMGGMFIGSDNFNQDLSNWNVLNVTQCNGFSTNTPQWTLPKPNFTNCNPN